MRNLIVALITTIFTPSTALAQGASCGDSAALFAGLSDRYGESIQSLGMTDAGVVVQMWANVETGTWTAVVMRPDGIACVVASGQGFERVDSAALPTGLKV